MNIPPPLVLPKTALPHRIAMPPPICARAGMENVFATVQVEWHRQGAMASLIGTVATRISQQAAPRNTPDASGFFGCPAVGYPDYPLPGEATMRLV